MKRVVIGLLLLAMMLAGMMNAYAAEAEITVQVRASKTEVEVGDTVEYTVLATGSGVVAMQFEVRLPEGLRYVPNSGATPENLAQKLGVPAADWTEQSMMFTFYNDVGITFASGTEILHFTCVAEKEGQWEVELFELLPFDGDFMEFTPKLQVQQVRVGNQVTQETVPAVVPETTPTQSTTEETVSSDTTEETVSSDTTEETEVTIPVTQGNQQLPEEETDPEPPVSTDQQGQEEIKTTGKTKNWIYPVIGGAVVVAAAVIFLLNKKKHA